MLPPPCFDIGHGMVRLMWGGGFVLQSVVGTFIRLFFKQQIYSCHTLIKGRLHKVLNSHILIWEWHFIFNKCTIISVSVIASIYYSYLCFYTFSTFLEWSQGLVHTVEFLGRFFPFQHAVIIGMAQLYWPNIIPCVVCCTDKRACSLLNLMCSQSESKPTGRDEDALWRVYSYF